MTNEPGAGEFYPFVGVGPHPKPWPVGEQYDPELLENGDIAIGALLQLLLI
jgi:hypothetical protein